MERIKDTGEMIIRCVRFGPEALRPNNDGWRGGLRPTCAEEAAADRQEKSIDDQRERTPFGELHFARTHMSFLYELRAFLCQNITKRASFRDDT